jgi:hypothetical protein
MNNNCRIREKFDKRLSKHVAKIEKYKLKVMKRLQMEQMHNERTEN